jgi:hypothetical protein
MIRTAAFGMLCLLGSPAMAAQTYGDWTVRGSDGVTEAHTTNAEGDVFGILCSEDCDFYLSTGRRCEEGGRYPALLISASVALAEDFGCLIADEDHLLTLDVEYLSDEMLKDGATIAVVMPRRGSTVSISRFSLKGSFEAVKAAIESVEETGSHKPNPVKLTI